MISSNNTYKNCPLLQRMNCGNNEIYCYDCYCYDESNPKFRYIPLDKNIEHPYRKEERDERRRRGRTNNRKGRVNERVIMRRIKDGEVNRSSIGYDGLIGKKGRYKVEIKSRIGEVKRWPSSKEWKKFVINRLDFFIVDMGERDVRVCMTLDKLNELLELIKDE